MANDIEPKMPGFLKPSAPEAFFNRAFGFLVGPGIGPDYLRLLQVRGRKTGRIYSTPVNLEFGGKPILVAPRGRTQWVRNAETAGEITLKKGSVQKNTACARFPTTINRKSSNSISRSANPQCSAIFRCPPGPRQSASAG